MVASQLYDGGLLEKVDVEHIRKSSPPNLSHNFLIFCTAQDHL
jgi:hypothetical protein